MTSYSLKSDFVTALDRDVREFVQGADQHADEKRFNILALRQFELQYQTIGAYRAYCDKKKVTPETIADWWEIPAVPSFSFTKVLRDAVPRSQREEASLASDMIELTRKRRPFYPDKGAVTVMNTANDMLAKEFLFPDVETIKMLFLVPPPVMAPGMVMASGLQHLKGRFGTADSGFLISFRGLKLKTLFCEIQHAEKTGQPLALIGATMVLDYFFQACEKERIRFRLPPGSRVCDSGGYQGRYTKRAPEDFVRICGAVLDVNEAFCVNALWLCENSTVYYDNVLSNAVRGVQNERAKEIPPWCRVVVVHPKDFHRPPKGERGLLRHYDLTNRAMAFSVQTDKVGYETEQGFEVVGKWDRNIGAAGIDHAASHPGGRAVTRIMDSVMRRKFSHAGDLYRRLA